MAISAASLLFAATLMGAAMPPAAAPGGVHETVKVNPDEMACVPRGVDLSAPHALHFTPGQLHAYESAYRSAEVKGLRSSLDAYRGGAAGARTAKALRPFGRSLASDRFILLEDDRGLFGGRWLTIRFRRHRDSVYHAWIKPLAGRWTLIEFERAVCTQPQIRWLDATFAEGEADRLDG